MDALPADVEGQLADAKVAQEKVAADLAVVLEMIRGGVTPAGAPLKPLDKAQAYLAVSQAVHALFTLHTSAGGLDPQAIEAIQKEDQRLQVYAKKVDKAVAAQILKESRPSVSLNVGAANRFISSAISDLTAEQKAALHQATQDVKRKAEQQDQQRQAKGGQSRPANNSEQDGSATKKPKLPAKEAAMAFLSGLQQERQTQAVGVAVPTTLPGGVDLGDAKGPALPQ